MRILLVEDNFSLTEYVSECLAGEDHCVDVVGTVSEAEAAIYTIPYDVLILDLGLPDGDGLDFLKGIRAAGKHVPVLVLTGRDKIDARVKGLNSGADDYMLKPFSVEELNARIRALLRRPNEALQTIITCGNVSFNVNDREVRVDDKLVKASRREMGVLEQLLRRAEHVVSKDTLENKLYGFGDEVSSNTLEANVSRLRKRLSNANASVVIQTLRGVGYLIGPKN